MRATKIYNPDDKLLDRQLEEFASATIRATPLYANNAAAIAGGLAKGQRYHTAAGVVMEVV